MSDREGRCRTVVALLPDGITPVLCMLAAGHDEPRKLFDVFDAEKFVLQPGSPHVARVERAL